MKETKERNKIKREKGKIRENKPNHEQGNDKEVEGSEYDTGKKGKNKIK